MEADTKATMKRARKMEKGSIRGETEATSLVLGETTR